MKSIDKYLFQALDNYPYWLEGTIESLDYALSYDDENTMALCLYARIQSEQLLNFEEAKKYFQKALGINIHAVEIYPFYIQTLIQNEDFDEAQKLIDFALTLKGINKPEILSKKVLLLEYKNEFKLAKKALKELKLLACSNDYNSFIEDTKKRLNEKIKMLEPKENASKKNSKKSENKDKKSKNKKSNK